MVESGVSGRRSESLEGSTSANKEKKNKQQRREEEREIFIESWGGEGPL